MGSCKKWKHVGTVFLEGFVENMEVVDGFIFSLVWRSNMIKIYDLAKVVSGGPTNPVKIIFNHDFYHGLGKFINYNNQLNQLVVGREGNLFIYKFNESEKDETEKSALSRCTIPK